MTTIIGDSIRRAVGALLISTAPLVSFQVMGADTQPQESVVVEAARPTAKVVGRADIPGRVVRVELRGEVSYSDLDLSIASNAKVLNERVRDAARLICSDLDKIYHLNESEDACAANAERNAKVQVDAAIAAAQSPSAKPK